MPKGIGAAVSRTKRRNASGEEPGACLKSQGVEARQIGSAPTQPGVPVRTVDVDSALAGDRPIAARQTGRRYYWSFLQVAIDYRFVH